MGMQIDNPEVAITVRRDRKTKREYRFELEVKISPGEIDLFDRSIEATTSFKQIGDLGRNRTWHSVGELT
jgi:hypothetical protein